MKTLAASTAKNSFGILLDSAQQEPVTLTKKGRAVAVVLSVAEYERLTAEFEAGGHIEFVFRPMTKAAHNDTYTE